MQNRINKLACIFENEVQEENFLKHRWKQISKSIKNNIWFNIFSGFIILFASFFYNELSIRLGCILWLIQVLPSLLLLSKDDTFRRKHIHKTMPINVVWTLILCYGNFLIGFPDAIVLLPFVIMVYNLKLFPFNFLWCTVPALLCSGITIVYSHQLLSDSKVKFLPELSILYFIGIFVSSVILIYDKWIYEKNVRLEFVQTQTIETTKKLMHKTLNRYFGETLSEKILSEGGNLRGEIKWVSISFTDISSYSTIIENMSPEVAVKLLNEYFTKMHDVIEKHGGQILNYIGDAIMVVFGAPDSLPDHEVSAVECAIEMRKELSNLNKVWDDNESSRYWKNHGIEKVTIRTGIHTGSVIAGNIGSERMLQYSAIGDVVNVASRLEQANKKFGTDICISEEIFINLTKNLHDSATMSGEINLKGRNSPSKVYAI